jgi:tetratricopeptide (TPR) repeat protein
MIISSFNIAGLIINMTTQFREQIPKVDALELDIIAQNTSESAKLTYDDYMKTGYEATNTKEYEKALNNFKEALKIRPNNIYAEKAISNVKKYIYNYNMEQGYKASKEKDYPTARNYFEQAAKEKPDDFYAQEAIKNMEKYEQVSANQSNNNQPVEKIIGNGLLLTLIGFMIFISAGVGFIIMRLFSLKTVNQNIPINQETKELSNFNIPDTPILNESTENISKKAQKNNNTTENSQPNTNQSNLAKLSEVSNVTKNDTVQKLLLDIEKTDSKERRKAIWELAQKGDSRAVKPLVKMMINANSYEKSLILEALSQISTDTLKPMNQALLISLQDENPQVRKNAIRDLSKIYDLIHQIEPLINHAALHDSDPEVREIANWALNKLNINNIHAQLETAQNEVNATLIHDDSDENTSSY